MLHIHTREGEAPDLDSVVGPQSVWPDKQALVKERRKFRTETNRAFWRIFKALSVPNQLLLATTNWGIERQKRDLSFRMYLTLALLTLGFFEAVTAKRILTLNRLCRPRRLAIKYFWSEQPRQRRRKLSQEGRALKYGVLKEARDQINKEFENKLRTDPAVRAFMKFDVPDQP